MNDSYFIYYICNNYPEENEMIIDNNLSLDYDYLLEKLPDFEPSEFVIHNVLQVI